MKKESVINIMIAVIVLIIFMIMFAVRNSNDQSENITADLKEAVSGERVLEKNDFCGTSTEYQCERDEDCITGGCSGEVCQGAQEDEVITTCTYQQCYNVSEYNVRCSCDLGVCRWTGI